MKTEKIISNLKLLISTIEELEIDNIITCELWENQMSVHLETLKLTGAEPIWTERFSSDYNWIKSFTYNNIRFYALYTQKQYEEEKANEHST